MSTPEQQVEIPNEYRNILVGCPVPGQEHHQAIPFEEFAATERGKQYGADVIASVNEFIENGLTKERATALAFGGIALKDAQGDIMRAPSPEEAPSAPIQEPEQPKKKNLLGLSRQQR